MSNSKIAPDELTARLQSILNADRVRELQEERNFAISVEVIDANSSGFIALLRDGVDVCFSYSFKGVVDGQLQSFSSCHEAVLDLESNPAAFTEALATGVLQGSHARDSDNFMIFVEVFDTRNDPNWSRPLVEISAHSVNLSVKDFI